MVGYTLDGVVRQEEMVVGGEGRLDHQLLTLLQSHDLIDEGKRVGSAMVAAMPGGT